MASSNQLFCETLVASNLSRVRTTAWRQTSEHQQHDSIESKTHQHQQLEALLRCKHLGNLLQVKISYLSLFVSLRSFHVCPFHPWCVPDLSHPLHPLLGTGSCAVRLGQLHGEACGQARAEDLAAGNPDPPRVRRTGRTVTIHGTEG